MSDLMPVTGPDGKVVQFPKGTDEATINSVMSEIYASQPAAPQPDSNADNYKKAMQGMVGGMVDSGFLSSIPVVGEGLSNMIGQASPEVQGRIGSAMVGAANGITFGGLDEIAGLVGGEKANAGADAMKSIARQANPVSYIGGELGGGIATGGVAASGAKQAGVRLSAPAAGAVGGATYGGLEAEGGLADRAGGAALGGAAGFVGGKVAQVIGDKGIQALAKLQGRDALFDKGTGQLTTAARNVLKNLGVDEQDLTPDFEAAIVAELRNKADLQTSLRTADAQALPVPARLTKGQATGSPDDLRFEDRARVGLLGEKARGIAQQADTVQQDTLNANASAIRQQMGGSGQKVRPQEGGAEVAGRVAENASAAKDEAIALRRVAEEGQSFAPKDILADFSGSTRQELTRLGYADGVGGLDAVEGLLRRADTLSERATKGELPTNVLMRLRQDIGDAARAAKGSEKALLGEMGTRFDGLVDDAIENALFTGDEVAVKAWGQSRAAFRDYFKRYEGKKGTDRLIAKMASGEVEPEKVSNMIFSGKSARTTKQGLGLVRSLRKELGENSPEWQSLRQEAVTRLLRDADEAGNVTATFSRELEAALTDDGAIMREFFNADEVLALRRLSRVQKYMTQRPLNRSNPSRSGDFLASYTRRFGGPAADVLMNLPGVQGIVRAVSEGSKARKIQRQMAQ